MERGEPYPLAGGEVVALTRRSPDHERNEDAMALFAVGPDAGVLVVADGMGGARAGDVASEIAITELKKAIASGPAADKPLRACILDGFENANRKLLDTAVGAATTLAVVEIQEHSIRPYHVGDSAILMTGQRGKIKLQPVAHSPVGYAVESGVIGEREAMTHESRHVVSNVVGSTEMHIEMGPIVKMARRDTLVLASDGLTDNLHTKEIIDAVRTGPLATIAERLERLARKRMDNPEGAHPSKPDDLSFLVYRRG